MILLPWCSCCSSDPPKRYTCKNGSCVEDPDGEYDEPTSGGNCAPLPCECPDWCLYKIEIISPVSWGPRPLIPCGDSDPTKDFDGSFFPPCEDASECCGPVTAPTSQTVDRVSASIGRGYAQVTYTSKLAAAANVDFALMCVQVDGGGWQINAAISFGVLVPLADGLIYRYPNRALTKTALIKLESECEDGVGITCSKPFDAPSLLALLSGPLEFTVNAASAGLGAWDTEDDEANGDQTRITPCFDHLVDNFEVTFRVTARENCEPPPDPCTVLVDGVRVPVTSFNAFEVITAEWRGLSAPGSDKTFIDGVLVADNPSGSTDTTTYIKTNQCADGIQQTNDSTAVFIATSGAGIVNACATPESASKYQPLVCEVVDEKTARLYGGVATAKNITRCHEGGEDLLVDAILEENQWAWECLLVDGVPGAVTVSPLVGARYFNRDPVVCDVNHEPPVVTLDFLP